jgi:hypothetical protein
VLLQRPERQLLQSRGVVADRQIFEEFAAPPVANVARPEAQATALARAMRKLSGSLFA